jgi:hypothetical protein
MKLGILAVLLIVPALAHSQTAPRKGPTAEELLKQVAAVYAHSGNFHVEVVEESVDTNELQHSWTKTYRTVTQGTGNRIRIEIRYPNFTWTQVSDGTTESNYWVEAKRYTRHSVTDTTPLTPQLGLINYEITKARDMVTLLGQLATKSTHATRLADETISLNGHTFPCYVVHADLDVQRRSDSRQGVPFGSTNICMSSARSNRTKSPQSLTAMS